MFKSKDDEVVLATKIERYDRECEGLKQLLDVLTCYIGGKVLQVYKQEKLGLFTRIMQQFSVLEISNSHFLAGFWSKLLQHDKIKNAS